MRTGLYKRHRFPTEIISHCVWLYYRFDMSFRAFEELLFERGVVLGSIDIAPTADVRKRHGRG